MNRLGKIIPLVTTALSLGQIGNALAQDPNRNAAADTPLDGASDIIVTAQRRSEKLRDVPISITALSGEALAKAGVTSTLELGKITPGVVLPLYGAYVLPSIRGISSNGSGAGDSTNVAVYVDGVYQANQSAQLADLPDVQSIEILKGPQGSLYGQNAAGGAIIVNTVAPSFAWKGKVTAAYGNFDDKNLSGYVTGPIASTLAFALSAAYRDRRGINRDLLRGGHDNGLRAHQFRGKLLWQPSDAVSLTLAAYHTARGDTGIYASAPLNGNALGNAIATTPCPVGLGCAAIPIARGHHEYAMNIQPDSTVKTNGISLLGDFKLNGLGTITTVTSYHDANVTNLNDVDGTAVNGVDFFLELPERDYIQELNFISEKMGGFSFTAGVFFLDKREEYTPAFSRVLPSNSFGFFDTYYPANPAAVAVFAKDAKYEKRSYAAYLEATYDLTDQLTLTAAGRYAYEKVRVFNSVLPGSWQMGDPQVNPQADPRGSFSFKKFTPRLVLRYKPDDNNTFYASYSKGFKSGYVNPLNVNACAPSPACIDAPTKPEVVDAYEIGYKGRVSESLNVSFAAFHYLYKDIQVYVYQPGPPPVDLYENAASGKIDGLEVEGTFRPVPELTFAFGGSYLHARYQSYKNATVYIPNGFGNTLTFRDVSGNELMRTPKFSGNISANYTHATTAGDIGFYAGGNYSSGIYYDPLNRVHQKAYALLDAELSFSPANIRGLRLSIYGKNLTDHDYLQSVLQSQLADQGSYADPRTYGIRAEFGF